MAVPCAPLIPCEMLLCDLTTRLSFRCAVQVVGKKAGAGALTAEMLKNPALMQALQGKLDGIIGTPSGYIEVRTA